MSLTVFLDSGPLSLITHPKKTPETLAVAQWVIAMLAAGHRFVVPAIADYEVRRELIRAGKLRSIAQLDAFNAAESGRFLSLTDHALVLAAQFWAHSRNTGTTIADPKELNADVIIAAQAINTGIANADFVIATTNVGHLSIFAPAKLWSNLSP
jgi:predicted nucleic acid-binding protein